MNLIPALRLWLPFSVSGISAAKAPDSPPISPSPDGQGPKSQMSHYKSFQGYYFGDDFFLTKVV